MTDEETVQEIQTDIRLKKDKLKRFLDNPHLTGKMMSYKVISFVLTGERYKVLVKTLLQQKAVSKDESEVLLIDGLIKEIELAHNTTFMDDLSESSIEFWRELEE